MRTAANSTRPIGLLARRSTSRRRPTLRDFRAMPSLTSPKSSRPPKNPPRPSPRSTTHSTATSARASSRSPAAPANDARNCRPQHLETGGEASFPRARPAIVLELSESFASTLGAGQAAFAFPDHRGALQCEVSVVESSRALEHGREVFARVRLEPDVVRLGLGSSHRRLGEHLRTLELPTPGEQERLGGWCH